MSGKEVIEVLYQRLLSVRGRIYGELDSIFGLLEKKRLNRRRIAKIIAYLRSDLNALIKLINAIDDYTSQIRYMKYQKVLQGLPPHLAVIFAFLMAFSELAKSLKSEFEQYVFNLKYTANKLFKKKYSGGYLYSDDEIREELYEGVSSLLNDLKVHDIKVENRLYKMGYFITKHYSMTTVIDLISFHVNDWPGLNDKWVCAATYLASLEVSVNKACSELRIKADTFKEKLDKLVQYMRRKGVEVSRIEKDIVARLYDYRCRVLHGGYIPTEEELKYIVEVVPRFIKAIKEFRRKS